jgi:hypothetical protein
MSVFNRGNVYRSRKLHRENPNLKRQKRAAKREKGRQE